MSALLELKEAHGKLSATRAKLDTLVNKKNADGKLDWASEDFETFQALTKQAEDEHTEYKRFEAIENAARRNKEGLDELGRPLSSAPFSAGRRAEQEERQVKSLGELFVESKGYKIAKESNWNIDAREEFTLPFGLTDHKGMPIGSGSEFKTTMTTAAGYAPFVIRSNDVVPYAFRRVMIPQLMPTITSTETSVSYMEETTRTVAAAATAETTALSEGAIAFTARTVQIEDVGESLPVSERQLADAPQVAGLINNSLTTGVERAHETQIVSGTGSTPQLVGFLGAGASSVQTQALGSDPVISAIMKAATKVNHTGFAEASAIVMHPNDYQDMILYQDATGRYVFGDPASAAPRTVWGYPVVVTTAMTENTALIGDFATYAYNVNRQDVRVEMGWVANNFTERVRTLRAYKRVALVIRRQTAFCKITGI